MNYKLAHFIAWHPKIKYTTIILSKGIADPDNTTTGLISILCMLALVAIVQVLTKWLKRKQSQLEYKNRCRECEAQLTLTESRQGICEHCEILQNND